MWMSKISVIILMISAAAVAVQAQTEAKNESGNPISKQQSQSVNEANSSIKDADQYQSSLQGLATFYDEDLKRLTDQNAKIKELFGEGLVSRRDLEQSDEAVAEARKKVEDTAKQIAAAKAKPQNSGAVIIGRSMGNVSWSTGNKQIDDLISYHGSRYGVDPYLIYCVMNQESGFRTAAISSKGAQGLMQLMPATAARYGVRAIKDPSQNIMGGTRYLKDLMKLFDGNIELVLAAYNAGEGAVMKYGNQIPPYKETRNYVRNIKARYKGTI